MFRFQSTAAVLTLLMLSACGGGGTDGSQSLVCSEESSILSESLIGDFSDTLDSPTAWVLGPGVNRLETGVSSIDSDYVSITIGACDTLDSITVSSYNSLENDEVAFMAIQRGLVFTVTPEDAPSRIGELYGYTHFGSATRDQDALALAAQGPGAIGFVAPLGPGSYTFWFNQTGFESQFVLSYNVSRVRTSGG